MTQILSSGVAARNQAADDTTTETTLHLGATAPQHPERADYHSPSPLTALKRALYNIANLEHQITITEMCGVIAFGFMVYQLLSALDAQTDWDFACDLGFAALCLIITIGTNRRRRLVKWLDEQFDDFDTACQELKTIQTSQTSSQDYSLARENELATLKAEIETAKAKLASLKSQVAQNLVAPE